MYLTLAKESVIKQILRDHFEDIDDVFYFFNYRKYTNGHKYIVIQKVCNLEQDANSGVEFKAPIGWRVISFYGFEGNYEHINIKIDFQKETEKSSFLTYKKSQEDT